MRWLLAVVFFLGIAVDQSRATEFVPTAQDQIVPSGAKLETLWTEGEFTEGPAAAPDGAILFSDIGNRILRFDPKTRQVSVFRADSGKANGLFHDRQGRLLAAEGANGGRRRISITDPDGTVRVLADRYQGKHFNSPNDLVVDSASNRVYFTDPRYIGDEPRELDFEGVFLVMPGGETVVATRDVGKPNGILVSPDSKQVYLSDTGGPGETPRLLAFRIKPDGALTDKRVLFDFGLDRRGIDGMTLDLEGNLYAAAGKGGASGIYVFSPEGKPLARVPLAGPPTNCEFGIGDESRTLYITGALSSASPGPAAGSHGLFRIQLVEGR